MATLDLLDANDNLSDLQKAENSKQALEEIQTEKFYNTLKSYYSYREADPRFETMAHEDLLDYFYEDRSWRNNNTISMGMDMANVMGEEDPMRVQEFSYIQQTYNALPSWWDDPNRSFAGWLIDNGSAMIADPVNLIGVGVGGQVAKQGYKVALKEALKGKMAKEINERALLEVAKQNEKKALGQAIKKGALYEGQINAVIAGGQDAMLQTTAIESGVQDEFSFKQAGLSSLAGFGFGTVFGGAFGYGGFKLKNRQMKNTAVKQLNDIHNYGRSNITGKQLFNDLSVKKPNTKLYKNLSKEEVDQIEARSTLKGETTSERIKNLRKDKITSKDKPSKGFPINLTKYKKGGYRLYIKNKVKDMIANDEIPTNKVTLDEMIKRAEQVGANGNNLRKVVSQMSKDPKIREQFAYIIANADAIAREADDIVKLGNELNRTDLSVKERKEILTELNRRDEGYTELLQQQIELQSAGARATTAGRVVKDKTRAAELKVKPEDPAMHKLKQDNPEEYWKKVGMLTDNEDVILALQNARKADGWGLAAEYVNNNLLSSPDTHILNIVSGLTQVLWKPAVMLLRGANMTTRDTHRAMVIMREALQTLTYQFVYMPHALKQAGKSFWFGRPILDSQQMKFDNHIRQGQLQRWINEWGKAGTDNIPLLGRVIQRGVVEPIAAITTLPMRVLSAGDEFLKSMLFKGRMASIINSRILAENPDFSLLKGDQFRKKYIEKKKEIQAEFIDENGRAVDVGRGLDEILNSPLQYAREGSYTQSAYSRNPVTNKDEGQLTGWILKNTSGGGKWLRAFGLHFINTPSNLLRWNAQHLPFLGRYQFQMRHMLAEAEDAAEKGTFKGFTRKASAGLTSLNPLRKKKYLNPEAAAEANARIQMGWLLWTSAVTFAMLGKFTGGGSRDYRINKQREQNTGWQPYSYVTNDGRYISLNRLDPIFTPFFIAADMYAEVQKYLEVNEDMPQYVADQNIELALGAVATLTRNITSKFYTKNIVETINLILSDDYLNARKPEYVFSAALSRGLFKITPLSGGLRYSNRITDEWERELFTLSDRLRTLDPAELWSNKAHTMPKRNMLGEVINRKTGWLFGLGSETGLWSTPFAMTNFKNTATAKWIKDREFNYLPPAKKDPYTKIDLRTIRNDKYQTAYDRWLELKQDIRFNERGVIIKNPSKYTGKKYSLKQYLEKIIADKTSDLYKMPDGMIKGKNAQTDYVMGLVRGVERAAYWKMFEEFPELKQIIEEQDEFEKSKYEAAKSAIDILTQ